MAPPVWAYQLDNFQPPPDEELVCSICQAIFCDPVQSPCNHVFCRACIVQWLESNRNCPICRKRTTRTTLQEVVPIVKNLIMKLVLHCHNSERGCKAKFPLESCEAHIKDCQYELIQCKNRPCKETFMRKDIKDHENSCPHSYLRCNVCNLKVSARNSVHSCIDALKVKLKEKDEKLKKYREKLKKLKEELKNMRESEGFTSDSSVINLSPAEILFNFAENSNLSEFSSFSASSEESVNIQSSADESEENWPSPIQTREDMIFELEQLQGRIDNLRSATDEIVEDNNTSPEYPRASSAASANDSSILVEPVADSFEEEPEGMIRPAKRRLVTHYLSSSDEDEQLEVAPQPSRKRTLQHQEGASSNNLDNIAGPSYRSLTSDFSTSNNDSSPSNHNRFKLRPKKLKLRTAEARSVPVTSPSTVSSSQNGNPVFERTLSLLEQYNLESDPEWLPPVLQDDSDDSDNNRDTVPGHVTSSDESSSSDLESSSSYEDATEVRAADLLNSFYGSSDSDEWLPPH